MSLRIFLSVIFATSTIPKINNFLVCFERSQMADVLIFVFLLRSSGSVWFILRKVIRKSVSLQGNRKFFFSTHRNLLFLTIRSEILQLSQQLMLENAERLLIYLRAINSRCWFSKKINFFSSPFSSREWLMGVWNLHRKWFSALFLSFQSTDFLFTRTFYFLQALDLSPVAFHFQVYWLNKSFDKLITNDNAIIKSFIDELIIIEHFKLLLMTIFDSWKPVEKW